MCAPNVKYTPTMSHKNCLFQNVYYISFFARMYKKVLNFKLND